MSAAPLTLVDAVDGLGRARNLLAGLGLAAEGLGSEPLAAMCLVIDGELAAVRGVLEAAQASAKAAARARLCAEFDKLPTTAERWFAEWAEAAAEVDGGDLDMASFEAACRRQATALDGLIEAPTTDLSDLACKLVAVCRWDDRERFHSLRGKQLLAEARSIVERAGVA